jgi:type VI secretion system secreted protein Hcp
VAVQYFLRVDGIPGESKDAAHKGEIDVLSFAWGLTNSGGAAPGGGAGAGKASFQDLHVVKPVDKASPKLFEACASGQHIKEVVLTGRRTGKKQLEFLSYKLSNVVITSYQIGGSAPEAPTDQVSLNSGKIEMEYRPAGAEPAVRAGWDVAAGRKV